MNKRLKKFARKVWVPRFVRQVAVQLGVTSQPNPGSSLYNVPDPSPIYEFPLVFSPGTIRISEHWNFKKSQRSETVSFITDDPVGPHTWAIGVYDTDQNGAPVWRIVSRFTRNERLNIPYVRQKLNIMVAEATWGYLKNVKMPIWQFKMPEKIVARHKEPVVRQHVARRAS